MDSIAAKYRKCVFAFALLQGICMMGAALLREAIEMFPFLRFLFMHYILLSLIPVIGAFMLWSKASCYGFIVVFMSVVFVLLYNVITRFGLLPPMILRVNSHVLQVLYEVLYWLVPVFGFLTLWFTGRLYKHIFFPKENEKTFSGEG